MEIEVGNITRHYLPKGLTMLFLVTVIAILVNELLGKMIKTDSAQRSSNKCKKYLPKNYS